MLFFINLCESKHLEILGKEEKQAGMAEEEVFFKHCDGSHKAVLFIHGILEGHRQFRQMAQVAYSQGYSTERFLLPGHGKSDRAFAKTDYRAWVTAVTQKIDEMLEVYEEIIIVGHSMGALLAICEGAARSEGIKALVLIDPPLRIHLWYRVIKGAVKIRLGQVRREEEYTLAEAHAISVGPLKYGSVIGWLLRYSELLSIIHYTKKQIPKLDLPLLVSFAAKDEFVSLKSNRYFKDYYGNIKMLYLKDSGHFCYHHTDIAILMGAYKDFLMEQKEVL